MVKEFENALVDVETWSMGDNVLEQQNFMYGLFVAMEIVLTVEERLQVIEKSLLRIKDYDLEYILKKEKEKLEEEK